MVSPFGPPPLVKSFALTFLLCSAAVLASPGRNYQGVAGAELSEAAPISGPRGWDGPDRAQALAALAATSGGDRQGARWTYAKSLIAEGRPADALGVIEVMVQDEPDLALLGNVQLARGLALASLTRHQEAVAALSLPSLAANPEACAWRLRALVGAGVYPLAARQIACAQAAVSARPVGQRTPFVLAASDTALALGKPRLALDWLRHIARGDAGAALRRAEAFAALQEHDSARRTLDVARSHGSPEQRATARLFEIRLNVERRAMPPREALRRLETLRFTWRGGPVEEQALRLSYRLAREQNKPFEALRAAATLIRHFPVGPDTAALMQSVQRDMAALLGPDNRMGLAQAAGLFWDYRDLAPGGPAGDRLAGQLADRLQAAGLYGRAAELLEHQLTTRARDVAQGPLSVRVARLHILAGKPDRALAALRRTSHTLLPQSMIWDRQRVEAIALHQRGRTREALVILGDVPGSAGLRTELMWKQRNWEALAAFGAPALPAPGRLTEAAQALVLRHAIALSMLGRSDELAQLRTRYGTAFAALPTARAFDLLTSDRRTITPDGLAEAMSALPSVSPAGDLGDLLEVAPRNG